MPHTAQAAPLSDSSVPVQAKLAAAWTSFMFMYIYADYFLLYKPGFIDELRAGSVHGYDLGLTFATVGLAFLAVPSVMILLSMALPPRLNRAVNLVVAALYVPFTAYNLTGESTWLPFFGLAVGVELLLLAYIVRAAWTWRHTPSSVATTALREGAAV